MDIVIPHIAHKQQGASVQTFPHGRPLDREQLVGIDCDIWIPAARPDVLTEENIGQLKARLVLQGANIPATMAAER
jgi:glutamate dehydrogenase (NAD(P)+)